MKRTAGIMAQQSTYNLPNGYELYYFADGDYGWIGNGAEQWGYDSFVSAVEGARKHYDNYEPPDIPGWEGGFADNH